MKLKIYSALMALMCIISLQSCSDDDNQPVVSQEVQRAFAEKYPSATHVEWKSKSGCYVADFHEKAYEASAWFSPNGVWHMTETDIPFAALPELVKSAFEQSDYNSWTIDDADKLERRDMETIYAIEVEKKSQGSEQEMDLYYSAEGILIKAVADTDSDNDHADFLPSQLPEMILAFINERYPGSRLVETEIEHGMTEVGIIHDNLSKDVLFNKDNSWVFTSWDVRRSDLPAAITQALAKSEYSAFSIDDAEYFETPQGNYYQLELDQGEEELKVKIDTNGKFI